MRLRLWTHSPDSLGSLGFYGAAAAAPLAHLHQDLGRSRRAWESWHSGVAPRCITVLGGRGSCVLLRQLCLLPPTTMLQGQHSVETSNDLQLQRQPPPYKKLRTKKKRAMDACERTTTVSDIGACGLLFASTQGLACMMITSAHWRGVVITNC